VASTDAIYRAWRNTLKLHPGTGYSFSVFMLCVGEFRIIAGHTLRVVLSCGRLGHRNDGARRCAWRHEMLPAAYHNDSLYVKGTTAGSLFTQIIALPSACRSITRSIE